MRPYALHLEGSPEDAVEAIAFGEHLLEELRLRCETAGIDSATIERPGPDGTSTVRAEVRMDVDALKITVRKPIIKVPKGVPSYGLIANPADTIQDNTDLPPPMAPFGYGQHIFSTTNNSSESNAKAARTTGKQYGGLYWHNADWTLRVSWGDDDEYGPLGFGAGGLFCNGAKIGDVTNAVPGYTCYLTCAGVTEPDPVTGARTVYLGISRYGIHDKAYDTYKGELYTAPASLDLDGAIIGIGALTLAPGSPQAWYSTFDEDCQHVIAYFGGDNFYWGTQIAPPPGEYASNPHWAMSVRCLSLSDYTESQYRHEYTYHSSPAPYVAGVREYRSDYYGACWVNNEPCSLHVYQTCETEYIGEGSAAPMKMTWTYRIERFNMTTGATAIVYEKTYSSWNSGPSSNQIGAVPPNSNQIGYIPGILKHDQHSNRIVFWECFYKAGPVYLGEETEILALKLLDFSGEEVVLGGVRLGTTYFRGSGMNIVPDYPWHNALCWAWTGCTMSPELNRPLDGGYAFNPHGWNYFYAHSSMDLFYPKYIRDDDNSRYQCPGAAVAMSVINRGVAFGKNDVLVFAYHNGNFFEDSTTKYWAQIL